MRKKRGKWKIKEERKRWKIQSVQENLEKPNEN